MAKRDRDYENRMAGYIDRVLQELRENGFKDAAVFIENKLYW